MKKAFLALITVLFSIFAIVFIISRIAPRDTVVLVYFVKPVSEIKEKILPVQRPIKYHKSKIFTAINELLKGPSSAEKKANFRTEIPKTTKLINIKENHNTIIINLSKEFESGGGTDSMETRLKQLTYTARDASAGRKVFLELNGKKVNYIGGEGINVPQPLNNKTGF